MKERSLDFDLGYFSQALNTFNGKTDGAFHMDKIGGTQIVKDVSLGWEFIITIPKKKVYGNAVKGVQAIAGIRV